MGLAMKNSLDLLTTVLPTWSGRHGTHYVCYNADGKVHRGIPYNANDPKVVTKQLELMLEDGITLVVGTWQGIYATACNSNAILLSSLCTQLGMQFCLLLDPWCAKLSASGANTNYTVNVETSVAAASTQKILEASSYIPEHIILDFDTGANLSQLDAKFPGISFGAQGSVFSWIDIPTVTDSAQRNAAAAANLKSQHSNPSMVFASYWASFNDSGMPLPQGVSSMAAFQAAGEQRDYNQSVWSPNPKNCRILESFGGQLQLQTMQTINPATKIIMQGTWNDYDEQSSGPREKVLAEE